MRSMRRKTWKLAACLFFILPGILTLGCDRPLPIHPEVPAEKRILWPIEDVDDRSSSPGELELIKKVFAPGCEPSKETLPRYAAYRYEGKNPVQSGDSARVTVIIKDAKTGNSAGEVQWSLMKVNDAWRLKDAPLPAVAGNAGRE